MPFFSFRAAYDPEAIFGQLAVGEIQFGSPRGTLLRTGFGETSFEATPWVTNRVEADNAVVSVFKEQIASLSILEVGAP
jgi:hypothetical protein